MIRRIIDKISTVVNKIHTVKNGLTNIIRWTPIVWKDSDFSQEFIYYFLYHKFKNMESFFKSENAWSADALETAKQLRIAKNLAKRLWEDNYLENAMIEYSKKYADVDLFDYVPVGNLYRLEVRDKEQEKEFSKASNHSDYMKEQDKQYLFNYMRKRIDGWWD